jgi:hypothetical protein
MSYQTGMASGPTDLLQKLVTFLAANGWTSDLSAGDGAGWRAHLHLGSQYVHMRSFVSEGVPTVFAHLNGATKSGIALYGSSSVDTGVAWNAQPGTPPLENGSGSNVLGAGMQLNNGGAAIQNYYFFCDGSGDNVTVVVEKTVGVFVHMGFGSSLQKCGTWTGGQYFFGSSNGYSLGANVVTSPSPGYVTTSACPGAYGDQLSSYQNAYVRADVDAFTGKWVGIGSQVTASQGWTGKNGSTPVYQAGSASNIPADIPSYGQPSAADLTTQFQNRQMSQIDARANLLPVLLWTARDVSGSSPLGTIPNVFSTNATLQGFSIAGIYSIGGSDYMLFPNFAVLKQ